MTRFVILAAPRTGSNWLCTLLNSHPEILCHHELFNPQGIFTALGTRDGFLADHPLEKRNQDPLGFLEQVWQLDHGHPCVGFKWTRGQDRSVLDRVLNDPRVKKIVLRRCNQIKTYVSECIARRTRQWEVYDQRELVAPRPRVQVDLADLRQQIQQTEQFYARLRARARQVGPSLETAYEQLTSSEEHRRLLEYLEVHDTEHQLRAASVKQNPLDLRDSITNFKELAARLRGSELETQLHDRGL